MIKFPHRLRDQGKLEETGIVDVYLLEADVQGVVVLTPMEIGQGMTIVTMVTIAAMMGPTVVTATMLMVTPTIKISFCKIILIDSSWDKIV